jgi:hypothetical protein
MKDMFYLKKYIHYMKERQYWKRKCQYFKKKLRHASRNVSDGKKPAKNLEVDKWKPFHEKGQVKMLGRNRFCIRG